MNTEVPCVNASKIKKALKGMSIGKAGSEDGLTNDLMEDTIDILDKLPVLFTKCLQTYSVPREWKENNIIDSQEMRHPRP